MPATSNLAQRITQSILKRAIPTGKGWLSPDAVNKGSFSVLLHGVVNVTSTLLDRVQKSRLDFYRETATGDALRMWADDYQIPWSESDTDEDIKNRIDFEIFHQRNTAQGVKDMVEKRTGLDVEVSAPWQEALTLGDDHVLGDEAPIADRYYTGGTAGITTYDFSWATRRAVQDSLALGVEPHFFHKLGTLDNDLTHRTTLTSQETKPESGIGVYGGNRFKYQVHQEIPRVDSTLNLGEEYPLGGPTFFGHGFVLASLRRPVPFGLFLELSPVSGEVTPIKQVYEISGLEDEEYARALERPSFWNTAFSWRELGRGTWEEVAIKAFRDVPSASVTRDGVELLTSYDLLHETTYNALHPFMYSEISSL